MKLYYFYHSKFLLKRIWIIAFIFLILSNLIYIILSLHLDFIFSISFSSSPKPLLYVFICTSNNTQSRLILARNEWIEDFIRSPYFGNIFLIYPIFSQLPPELSTFQNINMNTSYHHIYSPTIPTPPIMILFENRHFINYCLQVLTEGLHGMKYVTNHPEIQWMARFFDDTLIFVPNLYKLFDFLKTRSNPHFYPTIIGHCLIFFGQYMFLQGGTGMVLSWYSCYCFSSIEGELSRLMYGCDDSEYPLWGLKFGLIPDEMASPFFIASTAQIMKFYYEKRNSSSFSKCSFQLFHLKNKCLNPNRFASISSIVFYHGEGVTTNVMYHDFHDMMHFYNNSGLHFDEVSNNYCLLDNNYNFFSVKSKNK